MTEIIGIYSNGAQKVRSGHETYIAYPKCSDCQGSGFVQGQKAGYLYKKYYRKYKDQCPTCGYRFGIKKFLRIRATEIVKEVKQILKQAKQKVGIKVYARKRMDERTFRFVERFNVHNPLAQEYRQILVKMWSQEPDFISLKDDGGA